MSDHDVQIAEIRNLMAERERRALEREIERDKKEAEWKAERERKDAEREKKEAEWKAEREKIEAEWKAERERREAERKKIEAERDRKEAERKAELDAAIKKAFDGIDGLRKDTGGISDSNAMYSEYYFYNSLLNTMRFAGIEFDEIAKGLTRAKKMPDGSKIKGEYDIVMYNGNSIALIEIKYKVRKGDTLDLIHKKINSFKTFYPEYKNYAFYLGITGMSFEEGAEKEAKENGVAILKHSGENVIIEDAHVRAY